MSFDRRWSENIHSSEGRSPRVSLACTACRRKKTKCDRSMPSCTLCAKLRQECVYPTLRLKPGPKSDISQKSRGKPHVDRARSGSPKRRTFRNYDNNRRNEDRSHHNASDDRLPPIETCTDTESESSEINTTVTDIASNFVKAIGLSSLIHPTHDLRNSSEDRDQSTMPSSSYLLNLAGAQDLLMDACHVLEVTLPQFQLLTDLYFDTMTEISLFHRPSFTNKIQNIKHHGHLQALFAAIFACSARFLSTENLNSVAHTQIVSTVHDSMWYHHKALSLIDQSLNENPDQPPSLCLLQAMVLITFCELTRGVRGRAWRLLGSCVRVAYELHLHLVDFESREENSRVGRDLTRWIANEERRRCWWTIWRMDTFASVTRRCPTGIDWTMVDTYLPVSDELWFSNQFHQSCFLEKDPKDRATALGKCGNESADAWLIVISSIMRDAQVLLRGNLHGVLVDAEPNNTADHLLHYFRNAFRKKRTREDSTQLKALISALQSAYTHLPQSLVYGGEFLDFGPDFGSEIRDPEIRQRHRAKYSIYLTLKHAQFMIYHHYAFGEIVSGTIFSEEIQEADNDNFSFQQKEPSQNARGLKHCLQAADDIFGLISRCSDDHIRYVSPFLASTVWLAASLQVLRKLFGKREDVEDIVTKYSTLRATCEKYTAFWRTPLALLENLDSLESRLSQYYSSPEAASSSPSSSSFTPRAMTVRSTPRNLRELPDMAGQPGTHVNGSAAQMSPNSTRLLANPPNRNFTFEGHAAPRLGSLNNTYTGQHISDDSSAMNVAWEGQADIDPPLDSRFTQYLSELFSETYQSESWGESIL